MAENRIPLFRIPFLALCLILDDYSFYDIIQLSLCSKRSLRVAKKCWKKKGYVWALLSVENIPSVEIYHNHRAYSIFISKAQNLRDEQTHSIRVGDAVVPSVYKDTHRVYKDTVTYWEDRIFGIEQVISFVQDLFGITIHSVELKTEEHPNEFIRIIDSITSLQGPVRECRFIGEDSIDDCITHLLDNCKIPRILRILRGLTNQFRHNWDIHLDDLYLSHESLFTLQNLMNIDCKSLELPGSSLTSEDMNQFLKHWQNGGNPRLTFLWMEINSLDQETTTSGIDTVSQPVRLYRYYKGQYEFKMFRSGGIDIQRNDGTTGCIFFGNGNRFEFGVDPTVISD